MRRVSVVLIAIAFVASVLLTPSVHARASGPRPITYVAIGDSFTYGLFASRPCETNGFIAPTACPGGTDWVDDLARMLSATSPTRYLNLARQGEGVSATFNDQVPHIPSNATLVTIQDGYNDSCPLAKDRGITFDDWSEQMQWLVAAVRQRAPHARIILATILNPAFTPDTLAAPCAGDFPAQQAAYTLLNARMNAVITALGVAIVDLRCDPLLYDIKTYNPPDFSHPTDAGYLHIAQRFLDVIDSTAAATSQAPCAPYTPSKPSSKI